MLFEPHQSPAHALGICKSRGSCGSRSKKMDALLSSITGDLVSRALSMVTRRYLQSKGAEEEKLQRLKAVLVRPRAPAHHRPGDASAAPDCERRYVQRLLHAQHLQISSADRQGGTQGDHWPFPVKIQSLKFQKTLLLHVQYPKHGPRV